MKGIDGENNWGFKPLVCDVAIWMAVIEPVEQFNWIQLSVFTVYLPCPLSFGDEKTCDDLFQHIFKWKCKLVKEKKKSKRLLVLLLFVFD